MMNEGDGPAKDPGSTTGRGDEPVEREENQPDRVASTPTGRNRVFEFADQLQGKPSASKEESVDKQLETWVTCLLEDEIFALPVRQVREIIRVSSLTRVPHAPYPVRGVTNLRGYVLPVVDLRLRLGLEPAPPDPRHRIMVVSSRGRHIGLLVDSVDQVRTLDLLEMEEPPAEIMTDRSYYLRGVIHEGDELVILLDADRVLEVRDVDDAAIESATE